MSTDDTAGFLVQLRDHIISVTPGASSSDPPLARNVVAIQAVLRLVFNIVSSFYMSLDVWRYIFPIVDHERFGMTIFLLFAAGIVHMQSMDRAVFPWFSFVWFVFLRPRLRAWAGTTIARARAAALGPIPVAVDDTPPPPDPVADEAAPARPASTADAPQNASSANGKPSKEKNSGSASSTGDHTAPKAPAAGGK